MWMLIHGFTGSPRSWDPVVTRLSSDDSPMCPAVVGHAPDWARHRVDSFDAEVDRLAALAEKLPPPRYLGGYSMGARLALALAARGGPRFSGVMLIGAHPGLTDGEARDARHAEDVERANQIRAEGLGRFIDSWEKNPLFETQRALPADVLAGQRAIRMGHDPEGLATALEIAGLGAMPALESCVSTLDPSPIWVVGSEDRKFTAIAAGLTARPHVVEGAGHNVLLERPDAVVSIMTTMEQASHG